MTQPALFVSHGSPMIVLDPSPARAFLEEFGRTAPRPKAVIVASAHYEAPGPSLSNADAPRTVHDFDGFPDALYQIQYPAPGAPRLAAQAAGLLRTAGFAAHLDPARGIDHGVWTPLKLLYPAADVPVINLSVDVRQTPEWHFRVGQALAPLREQGVLILGSGSATHNLGEYFRPHGPATPDWVTTFDAWLTQAIEDGRTEDLLNYRTRGPHAVRNHPTEEHILPLFVALGAASPGRAQRLHHSYDRVLAMDMFRFGDIEAPAQAR